MKKFLKALFKILIWIITILSILYLLTLSYCHYEVSYKPYRGMKFDKEIWNRNSKLPYDRGVNCSMYHDIVTKVLKKEMHISDVEALLGKANISIYCKDEKTKCITYGLGTCYANSLTVSSGWLNICFDRKQQVIGFGEDDYLEETCNKKFSCFEEKCECEKVTPMDHGGISVRGVECPFEIDKW